jgi:hypothetical protein
MGFYVCRTLVFNMLIASHVVWKCSKALRARMSARAQHTNAKPGLHCSSSDVTVAEWGWGRHPVRHPASPLDAPAE